MLLYSLPAKEFADHRQIGRTISFENRGGSFTLYIACDMPGLSIEAVKVE